MHTSYHIARSPCNIQYFTGVRTAPSPPRPPRPLVLLAPSPASRITGQRDWRHCGAEARRIAYSSRENVHQGVSLVQESREEVAMQGDADSALLPVPVQPVGSLGRGGQRHSRFTVIADNSGLCFQAHAGSLTRTGRLKRHARPRNEGKEKTTWLIKF